MIDDAIAELFRAIQERQIKWENPNPDDGRFKTYYAERSIYLVKDTATNAYYLIRANNPSHACHAAEIIHDKSVESFYR